MRCHRASSILRVLIGDSFQDFKVLGSGVANDVCGVVEAVQVHMCVKARSRLLEEWVASTLRNPPMKGCISGDRLAAG